MIFFISCRCAVDITTWWPYLSPPIYRQFDVSNGAIFQPYFLQCGFRPDFNLLPLSAIQIYEPIIPRSSAVPFIRSQSIRSMKWHLANPTHTNVNQRGLHFFDLPHECVNYLTISNRSSNCWQQLTGLLATRRPLSQTISSTSGALLWATTEQRGQTSVEQVRPLAPEDHRWPSKPLGQRLWWIRPLRIEMLISSIEKHHNRTLSTAR